MFPVRLESEQLGLHRIWATTHLDNARSQRVLEKAGMVCEGRLRHHMRAHGEWRDSLIYAYVAPTP